MKLVIDRQAMVDTALLGFGIPGNDNPILPTSPDAYRSDVMQRDVAKAKQLLAEAGHPDGISVDLHAADLMPGTMAMVQAYQQMASEAGIKVNIINDLPANIGTRSGSSSLSPSRTGACGRRRRPCRSPIARRRHGTKPTSSRTSMSPAGQSSDNLDPEARRKLYQEAQRKIAEEGGVLIPCLPTSWPPHERVAPAIPRRPTTIGRISLKSSASSGCSSWRERLERSFLFIGSLRGTSQPMP